ncbi:uncharacterized protein LOC126911581 [Spodoptera frugiperda]|uniref:Uncharacterized protein LOC126911581 n=1 Tax=Spodoptera frugiperda TaxID=7108 RepID=A0A9R0DYD6_SPOFR|nr:uncharacterized protein LOC126911581 [Spodoptera frugiperda]
MPLKELLSISSKLKEIKDYLIKIGPVRRQTSDTAEQKVLLAQTEYCKLESILLDVQRKIENSELSPDSLKTINSIINNIHICYNKIISLCNITSKSSETLSKMAAESFNLKTAIALLPIMTDKEQDTKRLIDSIQLYSSMINDNTKNLLIEFVLKTRLSEGAKLRLKASYATIDSLVTDMRTYLIQKKSAAAIQSQILNSNQERRSIEQFGNELEKLFVDLTIAQADGDDSKFNILRPINEKLAIKRFSDGLSNTRLSTIIASRQFTSLPEAIRTAIDEHTLLPNEDHIMNFRNPPIQNRPYNRRGNTYINRGYKNYKYNNLSNNQNISQSNYNNRYMRGSNRGTPRGRGFGFPRTPAGVQYFPRNSEHSRVQVISQESQEPIINEPSMSNEFFRSSNE